MKNILRCIIFCFLFVFFSTKIVLSQTRTSPFEPPEKSDTIFVVDDSSGLDTGCTFRSGGPLVFEIEVSRFVGAINSNGTLQDPDTLTENGIISETATLTLPVFDVDYDISDRPSLIELGVNPERDVIKFNGVEIKRAGTTEAFLIGKNNTWILNEFEVPIEIIKFPEKASLGNTTAPAKNIITIEIDQENIGNYIPEFGTSEFWCTAVDWAALSFQAMPPIVLIHGNSSNGEFWVRRGFTQILNEEKIPYDNTINLPTTTVVSNGATLKNVILAVARTMGVQNIQIIAHSKGGLDAREFLASYYSTLEKNKELKIHTFITLSTPHKGSVGADYIRAVQLTSEFKLENENERTDLAEFLSDGYTQDEFNANYNLTTSWVRQFNNQNCLPINIKYYSVGADADINNNGSLERNEYEEMLDEAEVPGWKRPFANGKMNTMYSAIGGFSSVTVRDTGNTTFFGTPIWEMVETPTITFLENDMMVTVGSAKYSFNFIIQFSKNHASVADQEVAREVKKRLIYAR